MTPVLELKDAAVRYRGTAADVVADVSLAVEAGRASRWSVSPARARRRCCGCCWAWPAPPPVPSASTGPA